MSSPLPPPERPALRERISRGDRTLGLRVESALAGRPDGIDFLIVPAPDGRLAAGAVRRDGPVVLAEVEALPAARAALRDGADGVVVVAPESQAAVIAQDVRALSGDAVVLLVSEAGPAEIPAADAVIGPSGRGRIVDSLAAARSAFGAGASLVVFDLAAATNQLLAELAQVGQWPFPYLRSSAVRRVPMVLLSGMLGDEVLYGEVNKRVSDLVRPWPVRIDRDDSVAEMAATVLAESPPVFVLAGHSLGGIVALEVMRQAPARVAGLVLLCSSARGPTDEQLAAWAEMRRRSEDGEFAAVGAQFARATLAADRRDDAVLVADNEQMAWTVGCEGFLRQLHAQATRPDSRNSLGGISVPVLVLSGGRDEVCPPRLQREIAQACPTAEWVTIEDGGHMLPLERPAEVAAALRPWLRRFTMGSDGTQ